jgi:hypothetical protein
MVGVFGFPGFGFGTFAGNPDGSISQTMELGFQYCVGHGQGLIAGCGIGRVALNGNGVQFIYTPLYKVYMQVNKKARCFQRAFYCLNHSLRQMLMRLSLPLKSFGRSKSFFE